MPNEDYKKRHMGLFMTIKSKLQNLFICTKWNAAMFCFLSEPMFTVHAKTSVTSVCIGCLPQ